MRLCSLSLNCFSCFGNKKEADKENQLYEVDKEALVESVANVSDDDSEDEVDVKNRPSKIKQFTAICLTSAASLTVNYFNCNSIIKVGAASLFATSGKSVLRNIPLKYRYILVLSLMGLGFLADHYIPVQLDLGPVCATLVISCLSRTQKLWILGKIKKDLHNEPSKLKNTLLKEKQPQLNYEKNND